MRVICCSRKVDVRVVVILEWDVALSTLFTSHLLLP
jgi:hypothetical protein